jgi:hypothetical protein
MPLAAPKYTQTFVPYIYSRRELRSLLDAVPVIGHQEADKYDQLPV